MKLAGGLFRRARPLLGTIVEIAIDCENDAAFDAGFLAIARIHSLMSFHEPQSDLSRLKLALADDVVTLSPETVTVLRTACDLHKASQGIFDVAIGRTMVANGFLPRDSIVHLSRFHGGMKDIEFVDHCRVRLNRRVLIDLGGIAKGYAVDQAIGALTRAGAAYGIVNAGGDLRIFGDMHQPITVRTGRGALLSLGEQSNCAIASSENSRTRQRSQGKIITPHIGLNGVTVVVNDIVTVNAATCMIADAMTKVAMVDARLANQLLGPHGGRVIYAPSMKEQM